MQNKLFKRFHPNSAVAVDREFIAEFTDDSTVNCVVSGWFMHQKGGYWELSRNPLDKSWPPPPCINPFFISIHLTGSFLPTVFSEENIDYLREHSPIGARDLYTLNELQKRNIPSYFSGCLTLTLENHCKKRNNIIYLVDVDEDIINYVKSKTTSPVVVLSHGQSILRLLNTEHRLRYTECMLNLYRKAKCVITTRLHAAMPCLAFKTPVLMISSYNGGLDARFTGLSNLTHNCSKMELCSDKIKYDFDNPPENPKDYLAIRENLIEIMENWVQRNSKCD